MFFVLDQFPHTEDYDLQDILMVHLIVYDVLIHATYDHLGKGSQAIHVGTVLVLANKDHHEVWILGESQDHLIDKGIHIPKAFIL